MFSRVLQQVQSPGLNGNGNMRKPSELYCEITINIFGIENRLLAYTERLENIGTLVMMTLENETIRNLTEESAAWRRLRRLF